MSALPFAIRSERAFDIDAIRDVTRAAFRGHPHSEGTEGAIVDALRLRGKLALSLVAGDAERIVGHVAFSPVRIDGADCGWFALGPMSVLPALQGQGIGRSLIREGLARLPGLGAEGCVVFGDPAYYERFEFRPDPRLRYPPAPPELFMARALSGTVPPGVVSFDEAFAAS